MRTAFDEVLLAECRRESLRVDEPCECYCGTATSAGFAVAVDAAALCGEAGDEVDAAADGVDVWRREVRSWQVELLDTRVVVMRCEAIPLGAHVDDSADLQV